MCIQKKYSLKVAETFPQREKVILNLVLDL